MKTAVVGPGAMGCLIAGFLAEAGQDVVLVDHDASRAQALAADGITIEDDSGTRRISLDVTSDPARLQAAELVFLCVKSDSTGAAMAAVQHRLSTTTAIVSLQNGLGNLEQIVAVAGPAAAVAGVTSLGATRIAPGHIRHAGSGITYLAAWDVSGIACAERAAKVLTAAGVDVKVQADCRSMLWSKLVVSAAINPLTALSGITNGELLGEPSLRETAESVVKEAMAVAVSQRVELMFRDGMVEVERVCKATAKNVSSMLQDVRAGRRTEINAINGKLVQLGRAGKIEVPANSILVEAIHALEDRK